MLSLPPPPPLLEEPDAEVEVAAVEEAVSSVGEAASPLAHTAPADGSDLTDQDVE